ncbi:xanthine dehydrogenase family protein molybdopterin-binding subunit [Candidatus Formimonas warabiya]|uniref:Aldehyde oxidase/xanthine dehydrogenase a/b hammerhead domain-containing protein n=1 Tax=Formimonas warabiya TaxID=1761012 RepID=A0A3G1KVK5_FORW1|nr:xanthine dehydrogenase family protein molybdopterin-binding subunit [Candidatus Formimonas warabiya]ATW26471.1 hypothetical protein DCMF_18490 [Candidatus Formimonas warabiya]
MTEFSVVTQNIKRVDGWTKETGAAKYTGDLKFNHILTAGLCPSPHPFAKIVKIDLTRAEKLPGVVAVISGKDVSGLFGSVINDRPILAKDFVRFWGEPVAAVAAVDRVTAEEAVKLIEVEYQVLEGVFDAEQAISADAPLLHPDLGDYEHDSYIYPEEKSNICHHFKLRQGDVEAAWKEADYILEDAYTIAPGYHACLESHVTVAQIEDHDLIHIWVSNQSPYVMQKQIANLFSWPEHKVRVSVPFLGGGFGSKIYPGLDPIVVALAMRSGGLPVKLELDRDTDFINSVIRHGVKIYIKSGVKKDGRIVAREIKSYWNTGAYADCGPLVTRNSGYVSAGPYRIDNISIDSYSIYTNNPVAGAFRGYGVPQVTTAYECHMDKLAGLLAKDPLKYRLEQLYIKGDKNATGEKLSIASVKECLEKAAGAAGFENSTVPAPEDLGDGRYRCYGVAASQKASQRHYPTLATIRLFEDGTAEVNCSVVDMGQGAMTAFNQIAAEELGLASCHVFVNKPDTSITPYDKTTSASRGTFHGGIAIIEAARDIKKQLKAMAAESWQCPAEEITFANQKVSHPATKREMSINKLFSAQMLGCTHIIGKGVSLLEGCTGIDKETGQGEKPTSFWMFCAHIAQFIVDTETGKIKVERIYAAHDVGRAINPLNCKQQIEGGAMMGVGMALFEELLFKEGKIINTNLHDYKLPTAVDAPVVEAILIENPHPDGPYGAVGLGEPPVAPPVAAIANGLYRLLGQAVTKFPLTPPVVLELVNNSNLGKRWSYAGSGGF